MSTRWTNPTRLYFVSTPILTLTPIPTTVLATILTAIFTAVPAAPSPVP